ncbi:MAG: nucleoside/nucleotide kinase family protein [Bifidobacteriaceae bacterium]|jgi:pantothenate kinase|nr:nucleoside/nucleotide kinase family protein [Bifidobacteriaceae bacterium]
MPSQVFDQLVQLASHLSASNPAEGRPARHLLGITGAPGSGKSTLASQLADALNQLGKPTALVPMDGFHLADVQLERLGRRGRKGASDTFDAAGYLALLQRLRQDRSATIYAPGFERDLEQPLAAAIAVEPDADLIITEGNYLLCPGPPWPVINDLLDEVWFVQLPQTTRLARLTARHIRFGKSREEAELWVRQVDQPNAAAIESWRGRASRLIDLETLELAGPSA